MPRLIVAIVALVAAVTVQAGTYRVPSVYPTIQAGIDAASNGDTVLVEPGVYTGEGNIDVSFQGKGIALVSETGPAETIIDCQWQGRAFSLRGEVNQEPSIEGFTIRNGIGGSQGGAIECFGFSPIIRYCVFANNQAEYGGALYFNGQEVQSLSVETSYPTFENCTFVLNAASEAGGVYYSNRWVNVTFERCLFFSNTSGHSPVVAPCYDNGGTSTLSCCDVFGNYPGDWIWNLASQFRTNHNFSVEPVLCGPDSGLFGIHGGSPLRPETSPCGLLVGALGVSCDDCRDLDADGLCLIDDNCPFDYNPDQLDGDVDGRGDVCEDYDGDGVDYDLDNCPDKYNPGQEDNNGDGIGDACCCIGRVGDANGLGGDEPTISDLSAMVDALFVSGDCTKIGCLMEADINYSGGCNPTCNDITISDIARWVDFLYITGDFMGMARKCPDDCP